MRAIRNTAVAALAVAALALSACSGTTSGGGSTAATDPPPSSVTIGYFPNLTHAPAIVGLADGEYQRALGKKVQIKTATFNSGSDELEAFLGGSLDIAFIGPSPTVTAWQKSNGSALKVIAGAAANGAALVVRKGINSAADLKGKTIATPGLGNTQDVAARYWLKEQGFTTTTQGGGDVHVQPQDNATALTALETGSIDGAWVPEPWATRMVDKAGAHVLVNEPTLWPGGEFVTTNVIVSTQFLTQHPQAVKEFLQGLLATLDSIKKDPKGAQATVAAQIGKLTGSTPNADELAAAWKNVEFTADPLAKTLAEQAQHAVDLGLVKKTNLTGLYDLGPLNSLLTARGDKKVSGQ
jgi:NitT/TauT family transport system substrate-binding protein